VAVCAHIAADAATLGFQARLAPCLTFPARVRVQTNSASRTFGFLVLTEATAASVASLGRITLNPRLLRRLALVDLTPPCRRWLEYARGLAAVGLIFARLREFKALRGAGRG